MMRGARIALGDRNCWIGISAPLTSPFWRTLSPWIKVDVFNLFNSQPLIAWDTTVAADPTSPVDELGLPTGYIEGPSFGDATSTAHFPGGREFRVAFGVRF